VLEKMLEWIPILIHAQLMDFISKLFLKNNRQRNVLRACVHISRLISFDLYSGAMMQAYTYVGPNGVWFAAFDVRKKAGTSCEAWVNVACWQVYEMIDCLKSFHFSPLKLLAWSCRS
jgi:hypothetical protein